MRRFFERPSKYFFPDLMEILVSWLLTLAALAAAAAYLYLTRRRGVWEGRGVPSVQPPDLLFGNNGPVVRGEVHISQFHLEWYRKAAGKK